MTPNEPQRSGIVNLGSGASPDEVNAFIRIWRAEAGAEWVALAWFAAGLLVAIAMMVFVTTT